MLSFGALKRAEGEPRAGGLGWLAIAGQFGVLITFGIVLIVFSLLRPDTFPTLENARIILNTAAVPMIVAIGLTVTLVMNDFDLSIGGMIGLAGGLAVVLMAEHGVSPVLAVPIVLVAGIGVGLMNGVAIAYLGASSFIITLAMASVLTGAEFSATGQHTIFVGIPASFVGLGQDDWQGLRIPFIAALVLTALLWFLLEATVLGRYMYAIGGSPETARLAGGNVRATRTIGFIISALAATIGGMFLAASSSASYPQAGTPFLLPAFAGAFLGSTVFRKPQFSVVGSVVAVVLLEMVAVGLIQLNQPRWAINVMNGIVLIVAVLFSGIGRRMLSRWSQG